MFIDHAEGLTQLPTFDITLLDSPFANVLHSFCLPAGAGATFVMDGFRLHFGWDCAEGDTECTPATSDQIDTDKGLINGLFGVVRIALTIPVILSF